MRRLVLAFVEGIVREAGARSVATLENWWAERAAGELVAACASCGRPLSCAVQGADPRAVAEACVP
jgi:hypothetical protein